VVEGSANPHADRALTGESRRGRGRWVVEGLLGGAQRSRRGLVRAAGTHSTDESRRETTPTTSLATGLRTMPATTEPARAGTINRVAMNPGEVESQSGMMSSRMVDAVAMRGLAAPAEARCKGDAR